ncbi:MAG: N,N-dimethylformamidase beta subunit family domain-containing protein [Betaproteobacteria bacterium]
MRWGAVRVAIAVCALLAGCGGSSSPPSPPADVAVEASGGNVTQLENARGVSEGVSGSWRLNLISLPGHLIEGYASAPSVNLGESIRIFVNTSDPSFDLSIYRIGWYGGQGGRLMLGPVHLPGEVQPPPMQDPQTGLIECDWQHPYDLQVPQSWVSGVYLVKLTASSGLQSYVVFVVRDDARTSRFLFQSSVTTFQAYNDWGGRSLYVGGATKVSFNRPYKGWAGTGEFLKFEVNTLRFLEREGADVSYTTNVDVDADPGQLLRHKAFLSVGHDEYWTLAERDGLEAARDSGVNLGFFGSNTGYWQVRLEPSAVDGAASRTLVGYKEQCASDPLYVTAPPMATCRWRDPPLNRPEAALVGVMYAFSPVATDIVIADCPAALCAGTTLTTGSILPGMLGPEADAIAPSSPPGITVVGASPYVDANGKRHVFNTTFYTAPSGSRVFAAGSMYWNWGLDGYATKGPGNADVQQMTRNVLNMLGR